MTSLMKTAALSRSSQVSKQPLRRVREVLDKKGVIDTIKDMFSDHFEDLMFYLKEKLEEGKQKEETKAEKDDDRLQEYINRIRRVRCYRVNKKRHSPVMMGRLLGKSSNKMEVIIVDTGTSLIIISRRNGIVWTRTDPDEPSYTGVTGVELDVMGEGAEEILIDLDTLIDLSIVPPDFSLPQDPELRSDNCRRVEENKNKVTEYVEELEKRLKEEKSRKVQQSPSPYQIKEFTLDSEVGPKLVSIQERQG